MARKRRQTPQPVSIAATPRIHSHQWLEIGLIVAIFFIVGGAPVPHVNETHYLTKAKHYWDPTYCPGDFFLDSADPHLTFYWTVGWLTQVAPLPVVAWIGRFAAWTFLAFAWQRLARAVTPYAWSAALSAALWVMLIELGNFAGEWVVGGVEAKCFAYGFVLLGLAAIARGEWKTPWVWFGVASAFHVLVGAWAVLAAFGVWLTERRGLRPALASLAPALVLGGLLSLPGLLPALALERGTEPSLTTEAARVYVFDRLPHHLAPLSLPAPELQTRSIRFGLVCTAFVILWAWASGWFHSNGTASPEAAATTREPLLRMMRFAAFALMANVIGLAVEAMLVDDPSSAARILRYYWFRQADIAVPLAVALAATHLTVALVRQPSRRAVTAAMIPVAACAWYLSVTSFNRLKAPRPPAVARMVRHHDWQDACAWIRDNTAANARFLIPRAGHSFKWYASRADVANYKDVPQDAASVVEWRRRCKELFPLVKGIDGKDVMLAWPDQWGAKRVRELAGKYGATHVISRTYPPLDLPIIFPRGSESRDSYYTVYETGVAQAEDP
jgi:hypothetical protein